MTTRLYHNGVTTASFEANILQTKVIDRGTIIRLDKTAFYPTSGGQPHDTGKLDGIPVLDVWSDENDIIWHLVDHLPETNEVTGLIDWFRRFDHMQQHTGQHIISAAFVEIFDANTVGFHIGKEVSTIDLDISNLKLDGIHHVENRANSIIWENHSIIIDYITENEVARIPFRKPPQVKGRIRIIWIEGFDASACGGTHVRATGEVGIIKIIGTERYKGGIRVTFRCGSRALHDYQKIQGIVQNISEKFSIHYEELPNSINKLMEESARDRRELNRVRKNIHHIEAGQLINNCEEINDTKMIIAYWKDRSWDDVRGVANSLRTFPKTILLLASSQDNKIRIICALSNDLNELNAGSILQEVLIKLGGKGGGSSAIAEGSIPLINKMVVLDVFRNNLLNHVNPPLDH